MANKIAVLGAAGMLGHKMFQILRARLSRNSGLDPKGSYVPTLQPHRTAPGP